MQKEPKNVYKLCEKRGFNGKNQRKITQSIRVNTGLLQICSMLLKSRLQKNTIQRIEVQTESQARNRTKTTWAIT